MRCGMPWIHAKAPFPALSSERMRSSSTLLALEGLSIGITSADATISVVRNVDITLAKGEVVGIVGESGSGKSLTALSIGGLLPTSLKITSGRVILEGREITNLRESDFHEIRGSEIAYVFQDPLNALNPTR